MNKIRVAWVPTSVDINRGSYRLQCYYNHLWLKEHGVESEIIDYNSRPKGSWEDKFDYLIWFRADKPDEAFEHEIPVIFFVSDGPVPHQYALRRAHGIVVDTVEVADEYELWKYPCAVVPVTSLGDIPRNLAFRQEKIWENQNLWFPNPRLAWVGTGQNFLWAQDTINMFRKNGYETEIISSGNFATKQWSLKTVVQDIQKCAIGIIPMPTGLEFGNTDFKPWLKDIDRVTFLQGCGLPVIAAPLPSYREYIRTGVDGIIADGPEEFLEAAYLLQYDASLYQQIARAGFARAWSTASPTITGNKWLNLLKKLKSAASPIR